ncbi:unnamed protein product [Brassica oleracea]
MEEVEEVNGDASNVCGKVKKKKMQVKKNILGREKSFQEIVESGFLPLKYIKV